MKNQDIKSGLFGGIGENMVAFELAKRNWYVYKPYFDTRIDFIAQKFVCKKCFSDWESKHIISCFNNKCVNYLKELNYSSYIKTRKCLKCGYVFDKYAENMDCPDCKTNMIVVKAEKSGQRNYQYRCPKCKKEFTSQTRDCVKCGSENCSEYPICAKCKNEIKPKNEKCINPRCNSEEYALIIRTIQVKSSHEEESETIGFNFKIQDLIEDERHFLVVYSRTFEEYKEKHNFWVMSVNEFKKVYLKDTASALIYQNARMHPPKKESDMYFDEIEYNKITLELQKARSEKDTDKFSKLEKQKTKVDVFGKLNTKLKGDF